MTHSDKVAEKEYNVMEKKDTAAATSQLMWKAVRTNFNDDIDMKVELVPPERSSSVSQPDNQKSYVRTKYTKEETDLIRTHLKKYITNPTRPVVRATLLEEVREIPQLKDFLKKHGLQKIISKIGAERKK